MSLEQKKGLPPYGAADLKQPGDDSSKWLSKIICKTSSGEIAGRLEEGSLLAIRNGWAVYLSGVSYNTTVIPELKAYEVTAVILLVLEFLRPSNDSDESLAIRETCNSER
jgi:hypothetical protein